MLSSNAEFITNQERDAISDVLITTKKNAKALKNLLEKQKIFNKNFRIKDINEDQVAVPIDVEKWKQKREGIDSGSLITLQHHTQMLMPFSKTHLIKLSTVQKTIQEDIIDLFYIKTMQSLSNEQLRDIPHEWQIHGDMLLLPKDCLQLTTWERIIPELWSVFSNILKIKRIAKHCKISNDEFRSSKVQLLYGEDGWITRKENGVRYVYDITKCMFSDGNITEKMRIAKFDCQNETVVDLFAGIGYFVIPYLVHAGAKMVYACEWNPNAIEALKKNLQINNVTDRCIILEGDNRKVAPKGVADHVNLGLIPSSEESWQAACEALNPLKGGWLHIHANVDALEQKIQVDDKDLGGKKTENEITALENDSNPNDVMAEQKSSKGQKRLAWSKWADNAVTKIEHLLREAHPNGPKWWKCIVEHIEHVKPYAPHIDHIVVDVKCTPV